MGKRQYCGGYSAVAVEAAVGIGVAFVFFFCGDSKLSQPQMTNLELSLFVGFS
jgi:hypothetical protein